MEATALLWPPIILAFGWMHRAAHFLGLEKTSGSDIRRKLGGLLGVMRRDRGSAGTL